MNDYQTSISIKVSIEQVFEAISLSLNEWWGKQDQIIDKEGTVFKVSWGEPWYQFKTIEFVKNQKMVWQCIDANQKINGLTGIEKEWVNSKIYWQLVSKNHQTTILNFKHEGLVPELLCFDFCSASWNHFLEESLVSYLSKTTD